jgi:hypothetical protein
MKTILTAVVALLFVACAPAEDDLDQTAEPVVTVDAGHLPDGAVCQACALRYPRLSVGCVLPGSCGQYGCSCVDCASLGCH